MPSFLMTDTTGGNYDLALADGGHLPVRGGTSTTPVLSQTYGPNAESVLTTTFSPGTGAGALLFAMDFTPTSSGLMEFAGTFEASVSDPDDLEFILELVENLTAITGGVPLVGATPTGKITLQPTSTTPVDTGGTVILAVGVTSEELNTSDADQALWAITATFQATPNVRAALVVRGISPAGASWGIGGNISLLERN